MFEDSQQLDSAQNPANPRPAWSSSNDLRQERAPTNFSPAKSRQDAAFAPYRKSHQVASTAPTERRQFSKLFMQEIPEEILHVILANSVRGHDDLRTLALCCKRWKQFSVLEDPWKKLCIRGWGHRADIIQVPLNKEPELSWRGYYRHRLQSHLHDLNYLMTQPQMTASIRSILINWLLAVIDEFEQEDGGVFPTSHHQTVALFDRYCSAETETIQTNELQMIGAACAVLAMHSSLSVEDIDADFFNKASFYTDGACTAEQVEQVALKILRFFPGEELPSLETACSHIDVLLTMMQKNYPSSSTFCLAHYLGELGLQAEVSLKYSAKVFGAAAYALSCHTLGWSETLWMPIIKAHGSELTLKALQACMADLQALLIQALSMLTKRSSKKAALPHVIVKYCRRERQHVAKVIVTPSPWPVVCPHGQSRAENEPCGECDVPAEEPAEPPQELSPISDHPQLNAAAGATPRDLTAERETIRTPANAPQGEDGASAGAAGGGGAERCLPSDGGEGARQQGHLQDVSFGAISDANDNSFMNDCCEDRRASVGERRASLGSVLGAVHEEPAAGGAESARAEGGKGGVELAAEDADESWEALGARDAEMDEVEAGLNDISIDLDREELPAVAAEPSQVVC